MAARNTFGQDSAMYKMVEATTPVRRDQWESKESASKWMRQRQPWKTWDERTFKQFIVSMSWNVGFYSIPRADRWSVLKNYCLRPLPTAFYPHTNGTNGAVTLTTHRLEEFYAFTGKMFTYDATDRLNQICRYVPVHLVYGGRNDMLCVALPMLVYTEIQTLSNLAAKGSSWIRFQIQQKAGCLLR
jgi:hypothetical protein